MENKEIKESYINEKTGIEYKKVGDYFVPNIILEQEQKVILNKYGRARLKFLKENNQMEWVKSMNNIQNRAEEIVYNEVIYS